MYTTYNNMEVKFSPWKAYNTQASCLKTVILSIIENFLQNKDNFLNIWM